MHYEIYKIKGRKYKYAVKNYRQGNKVKHKKTYVGPLEPILKAKRKKGGGRKPYLFVRHINEAEKHRLKMADKSHDAFTRDRARIVLLSSQSLGVKEITDRLGCELRKVRRAIQVFNEKGLASLERGKAKGAIPKFDEVKKQIILMHFSKTPQSFGYHFTTWTLPRFKKHLIDGQVVVSISIETLRQIIIHAGAKLKRSKRWQYSPDKEFHKKNLS
ncbi:MAG: helix-turn-helix domain-containing protein [Candidatus Woesearchaeota archaeon]